MLLALLALVAAGAELKGPEVAVHDPVLVEDAALPGGILRLRITVPSGATDKLPVILFSHGAYLSRQDYEPLVSQLAASGFAVVQPDHPDAGGAATGAEAWQLRIRQLRYLTDHPETLAAKLPAVAGRLDTDRIYAIGHSLGGHSVSALMGARPEGSPKSERHPAIRAAVLLAPPGRGGESLQPKWRDGGSYMSGDWSGLSGPLLVITGARDDSVVLTVRGPSWHEDLYWLSSAAPACLVSLPGAGHFLGGIDALDDKPGEVADPSHVKTIVRMSTALFAGAPMSEVATLSGKGRSECRPSK